MLLNNSMLLETVLQGQQKERQVPPCTDQSQATNRPASPEPSWLAHAIPTIMAQAAWLPPARTHSLLHPRTQPLDTAVLEVCQHQRPCLSSQVATPTASLHPQSTLAVHWRLQPACWLCSTYVRVLVSLGGRANSRPRSVAVYTPLKDTVRLRHTELNGAHERYSYLQSHSTHTVHREVCMLSSCLPAR